jgi:hypothetical protein
MIATCMAIAYATGSLDRTTTTFCIGFPTTLASIIDAASKDWWQRRLGGQRLSVWLGTRILNALRLGKYASWVAGPLRFLVIAG